MLRELLACATRFESAIFKTPPKEFLLQNFIYFQVGLAFCTLYTFTYRTTWCVFPFTLIAMCWSKLLSQCMCGRCGVLCCKKRKTLAKLTKFQTIETPMPVMPEQAPQPVTELLQIRTNRSLTTAQNSLQRDSSVSTPTPSTTPEINNLQPINESGNTGNEHQEMVRKNC